MHFYAKPFQVEAFRVKLRNINFPEPQFFGFADALLYPVYGPYLTA